MEYLSAILNLPGIIIDSVDTTEKEIVMAIRSQFAECLCSKCRQKTSRVSKYYPRSIRDLSLSGRRVMLKLTSRQFYCRNCEHYFMEPFCFVSANAVLTNRYKEFIYESCKGVDINLVAKREGLAWDTVNDIFKSLASSKIQQDAPMQKVTKLGIDEFSLHKGHKDFACVLVDLDTGEVIEVLKDRNKEFLVAYFKGLGDEFCNRIELLSSDMWEGFTTLAGDIFPNAELVVDRFHFFCT